MELGTGISPCGTIGNYRKKWEDRPIKLYNRFAKFLLTIPFKAVTRVQIPLGTPQMGVLPHLRCGQAAKAVGYRKPTEFIQDPSRQKTAEDLSPEERASAPGCPLRSGDTKRA